MIYSYIDNFALYFTSSLTSAHFLLFYQAYLHFHWPNISLLSWELHNPKAQAIGLLDRTVHCTVQVGPNFTLCSSRSHPVTLATEIVQYAVSPNLCPGWDYTLHNPKPQASTLDVGTAQCTIPTCKQSFFSMKIVQFSPSNVGFVA